MRDLRDTDQRFWRFRGRGAQWFRSLVNRKSDEGPLFEQPQIAGDKLELMPTVQPVMAIDPLYFNLDPTTKPIMVRSKRSYSGVTNGYEGGWLFDRNTVVHRILQRYPELAIRPEWFSITHPIGILQEAEITFAATGLSEGGATARFINPQAVMHTRTQAGTTLIPNGNAPAAIHSHIWTVQIDVPLTVTRVVRVPIPGENNVDGIYGTKAVLAQPRVMPIGLSRDADNWDVPGRGSIDAPGWDAEIHLATETDLVFVKTSLILFTKAGQPLIDVDDLPVLNSTIS